MLSPQSEFPFFKADRPSKTSVSSKQHDMTSYVFNPVVIERTELERRCKLLRSLHVPGSPLVLPNAWDAASAKAVVAAGFPVVATTSGGVAAALGYDDHERAPADEMLAAAARISRSVDVPVTIDAEAGYGMEPADLVAAMKSIGAAGCNLEDTNHVAGTLCDPVQHADWLRMVREAASRQDYGLVINARIDVFLSGVLSGSNEPTQQQLVTDALQRAHCLLRGWCRLCIPNRSLGNGGARNVHCAGSRSGQCPWLQASALPRRAHPARSVAGQLREPVAPGPHGEVQELAHLARRESGHRDRRDHLRTGSRKRRQRIFRAGGYRSSPIGNR